MSGVQQRPAVRLGAPGLPRFLPRGNRAQKTTFYFSPVKREGPRGAPTKAWQGYLSRLLLFTLENM